MDTVEMNGSRILTTNQLAEMLDKTPGLVNVTLSKNKDSFTDNDYRLLTGNEWSAVKGQLSVPTRAASMKVWSESGAMKMASLIGTPTRQRIVQSYYSRTFPFTANNSKVADQAITMLNDSMQDLKQQMNQLINEVRDNKQSSDKSDQPLIDELREHVALLKSIIQDKDKQLQDKQEQIQDLKADKETFRSITTQLTVR